MSLRRNTKYFLQKMYASVRTHLKSLSIAAFIVFLAVFAAQYTEPSRPTAAFAPESIGLGQGVAACFSGTPTITCNSAGQYVFTASIKAAPSGSGIQGFRVIFVTDLNNPEGSVKAEINNISSSGGTYSTTFTGSAGTQYWPIELKYADSTWTYFQVASPVTGPTCTIPTAGVQGYKVDSARQPGFAEQTITVQGGNQSPSSGTNPYFITGLTPGGYNVTSSVPDNHSVSYCVGGGCNYYTLGNNVNVTAPSGSAVDLWWQYSPWTTYCTTGRDTNNPWEWWRHDAVPDPNTHYEFIRAGDGTCTPPLTGTLTLKTNPCTIAAGQTTCQPYFDWATANTYQGSDGRVAFNIINNAGTGVYATETAYAGRGSTPASGTNGYGAALSEGSYTIKLYGFSLSANNWVLLDSEIQVVNSNSADLTVSGITPTSAIAGTATTFSATVTNTGGGSTGIGFKNFYQVKSGTVGYTPQNFFAKLFNIAHAAETITDLAATTMSALAAGGNGTATQTYTFPAAGTYGMRVCADKENSAGTNGNPNGLIAESDETNNCGGWTNVNVTSLCTPSCGSGSVCSSGACVLVGGPCTPTNACGQSNSGTYNSAGVCSVSAPAMPATYGNTCPSVPATNACGMAGSGTILCNGTCSAVTPSDTLCLPTVTLSADPTRVRKNTSTKLTWTSSAATSCTLTGQNGFSSTALLGTDIDSTALTAQTTFTLTCSNAYGSKSASVIVNLIPSYIEV